jgi:hypothetical protein
MSRNAVIFCAFYLILIGCGSSYNSNGNSSGGGGGNAAARAQGIYSGTISSGYALTTIVLPDDKFYAVYGTVSGTNLSLFGLVAGQGTSSSGTYNADATDYFYMGAAKSGTITAS